VDANVSELQPLQERIVTVLTERGAVPVRDLRDHIGNPDLIAIDFAVKALMRANKVSLVMGAYDLVRAAGDKDVIYKKPLSSTPLPKKPLEPPKAPIPDLQRCEGECRLVLPIGNFQLISRSRMPSKICRLCMGKRATAGKAAAKAERLTNGSAPANSSHTPPPPQVGSSEPPAISSEHPSEQLVQGTLTTSLSLGDPEALSPVGAADNHTGGPATTLDSMRLLAEKRAALIARRELLLEEYETNLEIVLGRIEAIDQVMEQVRRLCEETE
jgi:hypothetical protein